MTTGKSIPQGREPKAFLLDWMDAWLSHRRPEDLQIWRKQFGDALERWDLPLARQLLADLLRQDLGVIGKAHVHMGRAGLYLK